MHLICREFLHRYLYVQKSGLTDNLNGVERPVSFDAPCIGGATLEIVHSLAKWKRMTLGRYGFNPGEGLYTDMNAIRRDEEVDNLHSMYVDQWDWEAVINKSDRTVETLKSFVERIYTAMKSTQSEYVKSSAVLKIISLRNYL